jgi:protocatechuate 4,5-dioxygenase alpha chain
MPRSPDRGFDTSQISLRGLRLILVNDSGAPRAHGKAKAILERLMGTDIFDGALAQKGYALNKLCFSLNEAANREAFLDDEDAYCARYRLTPEQREAVASRDVTRLLNAGGNIYYLAKLAGVFGLGVQDIGAQQTGVSVDEFKRRLLQQGEA